MEVLIWILQKPKSGKFKISHLNLLSHDENYPKKLYESKSIATCHDKGTIYTALKLE